MTGWNSFQVAKKKAISDGSKQMTWNGNLYTRVQYKHLRPTFKKTASKPSRDARKKSRKNATVAPEYFQEYNFDAPGNCLDECSMHALNSTLVNFFKKPNIKKWSTSKIPRKLKSYRTLASGKQKPIDIPLWFESDHQLTSRNQTSVNWTNLFDYIDPGGINQTLDADEFYKWSLMGRADTNFKYAVAQLPTSPNSAHVVSIVKSKEKNDLILIDSNLRGPRLLRDVAKHNRNRWFMKHPKAYIIIRLKSR